MRIFEFKNDDIYSLHAREEVFFREFKESVASFSRLERPSISISNSQSYSDVDERAKERGIDIARRKTGGRFMYFGDGSLIFSFSTSNQNPPLRAYRDICKIIINSLKEIMGENFLIEHSNDIVHSSGRKIGGAAQINSGSRYLIHAYLRYDINTRELFRYCKINDISLENYVKTLEKHVISIRDLKEDFKFSKFYKNFRKVFVRRLEEYTNEEAFFEELSGEEVRRVELKRKEYIEPLYIKGSSSFESRGHCDAIAGNGKNSILKISELVGKVRYI